MNELPTTPEWEQLIAELVDVPSNEAFDRIRAIIDTWADAQSAGDAVATAATHLASWPDSTRFVSDSADNMLALVASRSWNLVRDLELRLSIDIRDNDRVGKSWHDLERLLAGRDLASCRGLRLHGLVDNERLAILCGANSLAGLQALRVEDSNLLTDDGIAATVVAAYSSHLIELGLSGSQLSARGLSAILAACPAVAMRRFSIELSHDAVGMVRVLDANNVSLEAISFIGVPEPENVLSEICHAKYLSKSLSSICIESCGLQTRITGQV